MKDHLGDVRAAVDIAPGLTPLPSTTPFTVDLSLLDFGARLYDPFTARCRGGMK